MTVFARNNKKYKRGTRSLKVTFSMIAEEKQVSIWTIYKAHQRGLFDIKDFHSIIEYLCKPA